MNLLKKKLAEWFNRYALAAVLGITCSVLFAAAARFLHPALIAYVAMVGDNIGFYGTIIFKEYQREKTKEKNKTVTLYRTARNIILEFGPAEYLDSPVIRPLCLFLLPKLVGSLTLGIILGNIIADITFYIPSIIAYEIKKHHLKEK